VGEERKQKKYVPSLKIPITHCSTPQKSLYSAKFLRVLVDLRIKNHGATTWQW
jgi:hypothetical protein